MVDLIGTEKSKKIIYYRIWLESITSKKTTEMLDMFVVPLPMHCE